MNCWRILILALFGVLMAPGAKSEPIVVGELETLASEVLDEERTLWISLPAGYNASTTSYPVLYLLDARTRFHHTTGTVATLSRIGQIPEMIVVGVQNTDRTRDLTPPWTQPEPPEDRAQVIAAGGGADDFLRFLREELIPHVESKYRTAPFRILSGHSFGGLFAVYALIQDPDLFDATLAISPSLWWDEGQSIEQMKTLFKQRPGLTHRLFLSLGTEGGNMLAQFRNMEALLRFRAPDGLSWESRVVDGESHGSIPILSTHAGLRAFFPRWQAPAFVIEEGLEEMDRHFASLSREYGYEISTPEDLINRLGYQALGTEDTAKAIEILSTNVERFPESSNVYDSLGEALEAAGRLNEARELYSRAYQLSEGRQDARRAAYKGHLEALEAKLGESSE